MSIKKLFRLMIILKTVLSSRSQNVEEKGQILCFFFIYVFAALSSIYFVTSVC